MSVGSAERRDHLEQVETCLHLTARNPIPRNHAFQIPNDRKAIPELRQIILVFRICISRMLIEDLKGYPTVTSVQTDQCLRIYSRKTTIAIFKIFFIYFYVQLKEYG